MRNDENIGHIVRDWISDQSIPHNVLLENYFPM